MSKHQSKIPGFEQVKRLPYTGDFKTIYDKIVYLQHNNVMCNDKNYGFVASDSCDWYTEITYVGNDQWHLLIKSLRKLTRGKHRDLIEQISTEDFIKGRKTPNFNGTGPVYGPHKTISLRATVGGYAGNNIDVKVFIECPIVNSGGGGGGGGGGSERELIEAEGRFCPFQNHEELDGIYGWAKYHREFKKNIWCFNTRNPEIDFISKFHNTKKTAQQNIICDMFCITNNNLEKHIEKAKLAGELKDGILLAEYGNMIDFVLNQRFELFIKGCIDKIKSMA